MGSSGQAGGLREHRSRRDQVELCCTTLILRYSMARRYCLIACILGH